MKITEKLSNRFLVAGIGAVVASVLIGTFAIFSVYGKAGGPSCGIGSGDACNLTFEVVTAKLARALRYFGVVTLLIGVFMKIYLSRQTKQ